MQRPPDLLVETRRLMRSPDPLDLIAYVSGLVAATDPRCVSPMERRDFTGPTTAQLVRSFMDVETVETSALIAVIAHLAGDRELAAEIRSELDRRDHALPPWLARLDEATAHRAAEVVHVLGDGENVMVGVRLAGGRELTSILYVDHNLGTVAKDGFVVDGPIEETAELMEQAGDAHTSLNDISPADARARMEQAIEFGAMTFPPFESDTWPAARPVVEWIARLLPPGGRGFERPEWTDAQRRALARRFLASPEGRPFAGADGGDLLESVLWYGCDYGPGDPTRWSPVAVEILLLDWIPRKIMADAHFLGSAPVLLAAFVRFCHAERGIPGDLTADTLAAITAFTPEYLDTIRRPRLQGPAALLAEVGVIDLDDPRWLSGGEERPSYQEFLLDHMDRSVGGREALRALDDAPLPDEPFGWADIDEDIRPRVEEVLTLVDGCAATLFDAEFRTAARRLVGRVALGDPEIFRRKGRSDTAAAAICWIIGRANGLVGGYGGLRVKDLAAHFGSVQSTFSQRASTLLAAAGLPGPDGGEVRLGSPELLTSRRRREIIELRARYLPHA